jgi:hypothetical protein
MDKAFLKDTRNEVLASTAVLGLWGLMLMIPNSVLKILPGMNFLSGLFSNFIGYMGMVAFNSPLTHYVVGLILLAVAAYPVVSRERGIVLQFLTSASVAVYGVFTLLYLIVEPTPLLRSQVLGMGLQIVAMGAAATELHRKVLQREKFSLQYDRDLYVSAFVQIFTAFGALTLLGFLMSPPRVSLLFPVGGLLIAVCLVYSSVRLVEKSAHGFWGGILSLTALVLVSIILFRSKIAPIVFLFAMILIWEKKDLFEEVNPLLDHIRNSLDY